MKTTQPQNDRTNILSRGPCAPLRSGYWIPKINRAHGEGIEATLRYARIVGQARRSLKYGEWTKLCESREVTFGIRQGQNLVRIDKELGDLDAQTSARLPWGWTTLYHLSLLPRSALLELVETKRIGPRLTESEAKRLVAEIGGKKPKVPGKTSIKRGLKTIHNWIEQSMADWAGDERDQVAAALAGFIRHIRLNSAVSIQPAAREIPLMSAESPEPAVPSPIPEKKAAENDHHLLSITPTNAEDHQP